MLNTQQDILTVAIQLQKILNGKFERVHGVSINHFTNHTQEFNGRGFTDANHSLMGNLLYDIITKLKEKSNEL